MEDNKLIKKNQNCFFIFLFDELKLNSNMMQQLSQMGQNMGQTGGGLQNPMMNSNPMMPQMPNLGF